MFTEENRSRIMRAIRSRRNRSTEQRLAQFLRDHRITGWRRGFKLPGKPDFVFPRLRLAVFTDGCFWHCHKCQKVMPMTNADFGLRRSLGTRPRIVWSIGLCVEGVGWSSDLGMRPEE